LWVTRQNDKSDYVARAAIAVRLVGGQFTSSSGSAYSASGTFTLAPGQTVRIVAVIRGGAGFGSSAPVAAALLDSARTRTSSLTDASVQQLLTGHRAWWKNYWLKSYVRVFDDVLERYYYGALYVMGAASRPGIIAPSMYGPWITTDQATWGGRYFMNYNFEAPFYGVHSSNRVEQCESYNEIIFHEVPYGMNRAHKAGYSGVSFTRSFTPYNSFYTPPSISPVALTKNYSSLQDQKCISGFAGMALIWQWEYTQDTVYLRNRLYPYLRDFADFWVDYLTRDASGHYNVLHSGAHEGSDDENPNLDLGFIRYEFKTLLYASQRLGIDAALRPRWQTTRLTP
jgi:trehalose/maltose hydrolase-like predicted phosphorylase